MTDGVIYMLLEDARDRVVELERVLRALLKSADDRGCYEVGATEFREAQEVLGD